MLEAYLFGSLSVSPAANDPTLILRIDGGEPDITLELESVPGAGPVRGAGMMIGISLGAGATALAVQRSLLEAGYIVTLGGLNGEVLVLTPALTIAERLLEGFAAALRGLLEGTAARSSPVGDFPGA